MAGDSYEALHRDYDTNDENLNWRVSNVCQALARASRVLLIPPHSSVQRWAGFGLLPPPRANNLAPLFQSIKLRQRTSASLRSSCRSYLLSLLVFFSGEFGTVAWVETLTP